MENQLELIAKSYDRGIDLGRRGINSYENFPPYITNHPNYPLFQQMEVNDSGVQQAVAEFKRIIKPNGKLGLDIPNVGSPEFEIAKLMEEYLGRPDKFDLSVKEFETILDAYFVIDKKEIVGPMIQYFLVCKM